MLSDGKGGGLAEEVEEGAAGEAVQCGDAAKVRRRQWAKEVKGTGRGSRGRRQARGHNQRELACRRVEEGERVGECVCRAGLVDYGSKSLPARRGNSLALI